MQAAQYLLPFNDDDWREFVGAKRFPDDSEPLVARVECANERQVVVLVDQTDGRPTLAITDDEGEFDMHMAYRTKDEAIAAGNMLVAAMLLMVD